jgi:hypothetical protein
MIKQVVKKLDMPSGTINMNDVTSVDNIALKKDGELYRLERSLSGYQYVNTENRHKTIPIYSYWNLLKDALNWAIGHSTYEVYTYDWSHELASLKDKPKVQMSDLKKNGFVLLRSDLKVNEQYGDDSFVSGMFKGVLAQIANPDSSLWGTKFRIYNEYRNYTPEMVEKVVTITTGMKLKLTENASCFSKGDVLTVASINNDGTLECYRNERYHTHDIPVEKLELIPEFKAGDRAIVTDGTDTQFYNGQQVTILGTSPLTGCLLVSDGTIQHMYPYQLRKA